MTLLIASWNVNSIRARLENVLNWMRSKNPDILLLQETKVQNQDFPKELFEDLGYNLALFGQKTYNGVAILSKSPLEDIRFGLTSGSEEARYIEAFTSGVRIASIYVPNGQAKDSPKFPYKLNFFKDLQTRIKTLLSYDEILVLGGDFNVAPTDLDVHDPFLWHEKILCTSEERQAFHALLHLGIFDALRCLHPKDPLYTWWDYRANSYQRNNGLRIDHFLASSQALDCLEKANVDIQERGLEKASDHAPIWLTLKK
ncbi:MAG: exodeoxyribonuclease III [Proteobacteria bacterium]|nr:exodeoxyribonuclease III [Pseudomonadota bacterium]